MLTHNPGLYPLLLKQLPAPSSRPQGAGLLLRGNVVELRKLSILNALTPAKAGVQKELQRLHSGFRSGRLRASRSVEFFFRIFRSSRGVPISVCKTTRPVLAKISSVRAPVTPVSIRKHRDKFHAPRGFCSERRDFSLWQGNQGLARRRTRIPRSARQARRLTPPGRKKTLSKRKLTIIETEAHITPKYRATMNSFCHGPQIRSLTYG